MSVTKSDTNLAAMTPAQQGIFFSLVQKQTPGWVIDSSTEVRAALRKSLMSSYLSRAAVAATLGKLQSPEQFCRPLLDKALSDQLGETIDSEGVIFQHVRSTSSLLGLRKKLVTPIDRDLLTAACENFELSETSAGNYNDTSLIYIPKRVDGRINRILPIKPQEFALLCRTLDLGKQYQAHITSLLAEHKLPVNHVAFAKDQFAVEMHIALMQKHISADVYAMLASVVDSQTSIKLGNNSLGFQGLELLGVKLHGAIFVGPVSEHADDDYRCVVYLPGDPLHPMKEYASFRDFEKELSKRLREADFRRFFMRFISLGDRPTFIKALEAGLLSARSSSPLYRDSVYVTVEGFDLAEGVFTALYQQFSAQVLADARLLVVPTGDEDEKTRLDRLDTYQTIGLNTLLFFSSFVPVVGTVMFAVAGIQLLSQIYDGIESWSEGEQEQATDYLFDVIENLILMAATTAAGAAVGKGFKVIKSSGFIGSLRSVPIGTGALRLWKPDLKAYRQASSGPRSLAVDAAGLVTWREHQYVRAGADTFALRPLQGTDLWQIEHPATPERYSPVLETNGAGAWRHDSELPQKWNLLTLFRRLGYREEDFSDSEGAQILAASGIDERPLRQLFLDQAKPMATLVDTAWRFRADNAVKHFIAQMRVDSTARLADADLQLVLLTSVAGWPENTSVTITDVLGGEVRRYGPASAIRQIKIAADLFDNGQFYPALLTALSAGERTHLLGLTTSDAALQTQALIKKIAGQTDSKKLQLFARVYQRFNISLEPMTAPIRSKFAQLPASVADELLQHANISERQQLVSGHVPLRLAEEARRYAQVMRLNRAYEGLYLDAASGLDADRLILNTLKHLPGWPNDVFVEITEWAVHTQEKASIGSPSAVHKVFLEALPDRFKASDAKGNVVSDHLQRTRAHFFQALWEGLPAHARKALGVDANDKGVALRTKITELALQRRDAIARAIGTTPVRVGYSSPMGLADRLAERATLLAQSPASGASTRSSTLLQRAQELYPAHSPAQIERFLTTLGTDEVLVIRKLELLRQEIHTLRHALERWVHRQTHYQEGDGPRLKVPPLSKARAARSILRAWRKETALAPDTPETLYSLSFDTQPLGDLPTIVGDFSHVGTLEMDNVGASPGLLAFLRNFTHLRTLSLTRNQLTRIPQAVEAMSQLRSLDLSDNQIQMTAESINWLSDKEHLHSLNLSFNPALGRTPDVSTLRQLRHLALRGTGIVDWPAGADALTALQTLDLRDNQIARIPQTVFNARPELNRGTNVDGNPLSAASLREIAGYQMTSGVSLGVLVVDYRQVAAVLQEAARHGSIWMSGLTRAEVATRQALWDSLSADPRARDFFHVLAQLHRTADFILTQGDLSRRVWEVLEAAGEDDVLRRALFRMARIGRVSAADAAAQFSDIEVRVMCFRAVHAARTGNRSLEAELVHLMRGLFRLQELERQATIEAGRRTASGSFSRAQAQELSLIYRVRLAQRLDLPAQPREMNFVRDVDVSPQQLEDAYEEVVKAEATESLLTTINNRGFWFEYLVATYQAQFDAISQRSAQALGLLQARADLSRTLAAQRTRAIIDNFKNENVQLVERLTAEALARNPGLTLPAEQIAPSE